MAEICQKCGRFLSDRYQHECGKPAPPKVPKPPRPPKPPAPPHVPAIDPVIEFTDPTPEQLVETPKRPPPLPRGSAAAKQRFAAHGMVLRKRGFVEELPAPVAIAVPAPSAKPITICDLTAQTCRWPLWDMKLVPSSEHLYCGAETLVPGHYCSTHTAMAYSKR